MTATSFFMLFLEGILAFISPCILPMLPVYIMYLAGESKTKQEEKKQVIFHTLAFIAGFTIVFVVLGATATMIGSVLNRYRLLLQRISGIIMILFGLNFMELLKIPFLNQTKRLEMKTDKKGILESLVFGIVFSFGWTPCLGTFLGSALLMAGNSQTVYEGMTMLFVFSMGLGVPFFLTAIIFDSLKSTFQTIKRHYKIITTISGLVLIVIGFLMTTNLFGFYAALFT